MEGAAAGRRRGRGRHGSRAAAEGADGRRGPPGVEGRPARALRFVRGEAEPRLSPRRSQG